MLGLATACDSKSDLTVAAQTFVSASVLKYTAFFRLKASKQLTNKQVFPLCLYGVDQVVVE